MRASQKQTVPASRYLKIQRVLYFTAFYSVLKQIICFLSKEMWLRAFLMHTASCFVTDIRRCGCTLYASNYLLVSDEKYVHLFFPLKIRSSSNDLNCIWVNCILYVKAVPLGTYLSRGLFFFVPEGSRKPLGTFCAWGTFKLLLM